MNLPEGHSLQNAKYHLTKVIGQGGFGITYLGVWHTEVKGKLGTVKTEVPVCIKEYFFKDYCYRDKDSFQVLVHSETGRQLFDKFKEKLIKEAKILSDVHHPFIVNVLEVFEENNTAYIAMEHIAGCSLKYMLDVEGVLPENRVLRYISQIGQALDFVHRKNILHLDIKPSNILIDKKNNARLIDFGVSKRYDIEQQETSTTMLTLSKGFAPIEQYDNEGTQSFSPCPDIYSLGATMYNLLTNEIPTESILRVAKPLIKPSDINGEVTPQTESAILKAMQVNPMHRYQSVKAMINELDIPSYFEEDSNTLIEDPGYQSHNIDDEGTELLSDANASQPVDDEQTLVRQSEDSHQIIRKKKSKRRILIPLLIFIFAFLGYGVVYLLDLSKSNSDRNFASGITMPDPGSVETDETATVSGEENTQESSRPPVVEATVPNVANANAANTTVLPENQVTPPDEEENTISLEIHVAEYNTLLESGKTKMEQKNYTEARVDAEKALETGKTAGIDISDVNKLIADLDELEKEARLAKYEILMVFGELQLVSLRETGKRGAIDASGNEIIPCKYRTSITRADGNRDFILDDNHTDIYDKSGQLIRSIDSSAQ
jgi:serine/threonine-protein kinase